MATRYTSELLRVKNSSTGKVFYYAKNCAGCFERISASAYNLKRDLSDGVENITIQAKGKLTRHFTTAVYYL